MSVDSVPQHFKVVRDRNREFSPQLSNKGTVRLQEHLQTAFQRTTNIEKIVDGGRKSVDSDKFPLQLLLRRDIHRKIFVSMHLCFKEQQEKNNKNGEADGNSLLTFSCVKRRCNGGREGMQSANRAYEDSWRTAGSWRFVKEHRKPARSRVRRVCDNL